MAAAPPRRGVRGAESTLLLQQNLPSNGSTRPTDIVAIFGFGSRERKRIVPAGWIFVNRRGEVFLEVRRGENARAAQELRDATLPATAEIAEMLEPYTFARIPATEGRGLVERLSLTTEVYRCFTPPLS
jgi:hypothetical protein